MKVPDVAYFSPVIRYDPLAQIEIFERRDAATGAVAYQTPDAVTVTRLDETAHPATPSAAPKVSAPAKVAPAGASTGSISLIV
jgi:hypothetical protein